MIRFAIYSSLVIGGGALLIMNHKNLSLKHMFKSISGGELWDIIKKIKYI